MHVRRLLIIIFFFQAEDGIRDYKVTGVQTCALPISVRCDVCGTKALMAASQCPKCAHGFEVRDGFGALLPLSRSEERRVGKERIVRVLQNLSDRSLQDNLLAAL